MLYSGVFTNHKKSIGGQIVLPKMEIGIDELDEIIFESITKQGQNFPKISLSIKKLISDIHSWIEHFEIQINDQLESYGKMERHNTNLFIQTNGHRE